MNQTTRIHSQALIADREMNGFSSVKTKYDSRTRNATYDACIHVHAKKPFKQLVTTQSQLLKADICIAPHSKNLTHEALRYGSHSFHTANTPYLPSFTS